MRLVHLSPELTLALEPKGLAALLAASGAKLAATATRRASSADTIARALFDASLNDDAADVLDELSRLATDAGRHAIDEALADPALAIADGRAPFAALPDEAHANRIVRLLTLRTTARDTKLRALLVRVFVRARVRLDRLLPARPSYEIVLGPASADADDARVSTELRAALGAAFLDAWLSHEGDLLHIAVLHRAPRVALLEAGENGARERRVQTAVHADAVRFDRATGRLFVTTARPEWLGRYTNAMHRALCSDARGARDSREALPASAARPSFSFKWIQAHGATGLAAVKLPRGVDAVDIIGCLWNSGNDARIESRGPGALAALEERGALAGGYLSRVTLRIVVRAAAHAVDVFMELPHRLSVSDMRFERDARAVLEALHVFEPGALPDDAHTLSPFEQPEWRWCEVVGRDAFDRMIARRLLARVKTRRVATAEYRPLGRSYVAQDLPGEDGKYALSEDRSIPACTVGDEQVAMWTLDVLALARAMRVDLGTTVAAIRAPAPSSGALVDLGVLPLASGKIHFFYALAPPAKRAVADAARACPLGTTAVFLVPGGRSLVDGAARQVELDVRAQLGADSIAWVVARVAEELGVEGEIAPWRRAGDVAVVIERKTESVWIHGVLMSRFADNTYKLLLALAARAGAVVPTYELGSLVSKGAENPDVVVRKTRSSLGQRVRASYADAGVVVTSEVEKTIAGLAVYESARRGYRMTVEARIVG